MTVTMNVPEQIDYRSWRVSWSSDVEDPTFYVYVDGALYLTTMDTETIVTVDEGEVPIIEVLDDEDAIPTLAWPSRLTLCWYAEPDTGYYQVQEYVDEDWIARGNVSDRGEGYFKWQSRVLEDVTSHQFRIIPVGTNGNEGTARTFVCLMVRHPTPPDVSYAYSDSTHTVSITED